MSSIDIVLVLDASGSMAHLINDTVGGVNHFLEQQRAEPGDAYVTLATFDTSFNQRYQAVPIRQVEPLTRETYFSGHGGGTALLDAVGKEITHYESLPIKADKTMFVIDTDGEENSSVEWTFERITALIQKHEQEGWAFVFLGANNSAWQGERLGMQSVGAYVASPAGMRAKYDRLADNVGVTRRGVRSAAAETRDLKWDTGEG
ncbi:MAG: vWA domain-containing protein [Candidatus Lustribacter sp.]